ncbi:MAG: ankyrin repeat domain-containing protein [Planctomycetia bacterium]|nr:ankyrin repeat domain-containing protein [Planctomycetia bacterium]
MNAGIFNLAATTEFHAGFGGIIWLFIIIWFLVKVFNPTVPEEAEAESESAKDNSGAEWQVLVKATEQEKKVERLARAKMKQILLAEQSASVPNFRTSFEQETDSLEYIDMQESTFSANSTPSSDAMIDLIPLFEAAGRGKLSVAQRKLERGANVNETDSFFGETPLHRAAKVGDAAMIQLLLDHGADVSVQTQYGDTPLHFAITGRNPEVIQLLLTYGANPRAEDIFGRTPAQCAKFYPELHPLFKV